jgi:hypothetical protein
MDRLLLGQHWVRPSAHCINQNLFYEILELLIL